MFSPKGRGRTDVFVLDQSQDVLARVRVEVMPDADRATVELESQQAETNVDIKSALGGLAMAGVVKTTAEAREVAAVVRNMSRPETPVARSSSTIPR
jgi:Flp pilus assembly secretin CpaC